MDTFGLIVIFRYTIAGILCDVMPHSETTWMSLWK